MTNNKSTIQKIALEEVAWLLGTDSKTVVLWAEAGIIKASPTRENGKQEFGREDVADLLIRLGA